MNSYNPDANQGVLEKLGIPVQTTPPEEILTAGKVKSVRLRVSRPHGYLYGDVESYLFDYVTPTLEWYADTLHQRDLAIHKLGELADRLEVDLLNARAQLDNKGLNDVLRDAVDSDETDGEVDALLSKIEDLQAELAHANAQLQAAQQAGFQSPDGEETYTREEVENFLASAVEDANNERDKHFQTILQQKEQEFAARLQEALAQQAPAEAEGYTEEEVEAAVQEAVAQAVQQAEQVKDAEYLTVIQTHQSALEEVEQRLREAEEAAEATPAGHTDEEVEAAVARAVAAKDEEILVLRAENKRLTEDAEKLEEYARQLDAYVVTLEQKQGQAAPAAEQPRDSYGQPLTKIRPEDL